MVDMNEIVVQYMAAFAARKRPRIVAYGNQLTVEFGKGGSASDGEVANAISWLCEKGWPGIDDIAPAEDKAKALEERLLAMMLTPEGRDRLLNLINADMLERAAVQTDNVVAVRVGDRIVAEVRQRLPDGIVRAFRKAVDDGKKHVRIEVRGDGDALLVWDEE